MPYLIYPTLVPSREQIYTVTGTVSSAFQQFLKRCFLILEEFVSIQLILAIALDNSRGLPSMLLLVTVVRSRIQVAAAMETTLAVVLNVEQNVYNKVSCT